MKHIRYRPLAILAMAILLGTLGACASQPTLNITGEDSFDRKIEKIDAWLDKLDKEEGFNASVLIGVDGRIVLEKNNGIANRQTGALITRDSSYYLASVSKSITALCIGMLVERKNLALDDAVATYLPGLPYKGIVVADLLHHTSGLPGEDDFLKTTFTDKNLEDFLATRGITGRMLTNADILKLLQEMKLPAHFSPGERWEYNNINYYLLASIIEKVTGSPFPDFVEANIARPLGLEHTKVYHENLPAGAITERVLGYKSGELFDLTAKNGAYGAGNVYASGEDLFRINNALFDGTLLGPDTLRLVLTPARLRDGAMPNIGKVADGYGMGWFLNQTPQGTLAWHDGAYRGFRSYVGRKVDRGIVMIVLDSTLGDDRDALYGALDRAFGQL